MMKVQRWWMVVVWLLLGGALHAQDDALNLTRELYVLGGDGVLQRYGLGADGIATLNEGEDFILDFAPHPDGVRVAYRTETKIVLRDSYAETTLPLEENGPESVPVLRGRGATMAWTASGDALAYTTMSAARVLLIGPAGGRTYVNLPTTSPIVSLVWSPTGEYLVTEAQNPDPAAQTNFWWVYRRTGANFALTSVIPSSYGVAWRGAAQVVFTPETGGVYSMDLAAANAQTELAPTDATYILPYVRTDGTVVLMRRDADDPSKGLVYFIGPTDDSEPTATSTTLVDLAGAAWSPDGGVLVAFRGGVLALVNPANGNGFPLPMANAVSYDWGAPPLPQVLTADGLGLPADGYFLTAEEVGVPQVWRLPADGAAAVPLTQAESGVIAYQVAPNGRAFAYRTGDAKLWVDAVDGDDEPREIATLTDEIAAPTFAFTQDGRSLAYVNSEGALLLQALTDEAAEPRVLLAASPTQIAERLVFAPNINALLVLVADTDSAVTAANLLDVESGEVVARLPVPTTPFWLADARLAVTNGNRIDILTTTDYQVLPQNLLTLPDATFAYVSLRDNDTLTVALDGVRWQWATLALDDAGIVPLTQTFAISTPQLRDDWLAGLRYQTADGGPLVLHNLATGVRVQLSAPRRVSDFRWG
jgi:hypothetical protein